MSIEPFIKCSDISESLRFYSQILDFKVLQAPSSDTESILSLYAYLEREGGGVHLSAHAGDGVFGNKIYIRVNNLDEVYQRYLKNGLDENKSLGHSGVNIKTVDQTWGMREFAVSDPDGNQIVFGERISD